MTLPRALRLWLMLLASRRCSGVMPAFAAVGDDDDAAAAASVSSRTPPARSSRRSFEIRMRLDDDDDDDELLFLLLLDVLPAPVPAGAGGLVMVSVKRAWPLWEQKPGPRCFFSVLRRAMPRRTSASRSSQEPTTSSVTPEKNTPSLGVYRTCGGCAACASRSLGGGLSRSVRVSPYASTMLSCTSAPPLELLSPPPSSSSLSSSSPPPLRLPLPTLATRFFGLVLLFFFAPLPAGPLAAAPPPDAPSSAASASASIWNRSIPIRCRMPGSSDVPIIVCVLPVPLMPWAKMVPFEPPRTLLSMVRPTTS